MYCSSPIVTIGTRIAAAPKHSSGMTVTMPVVVRAPRGRGPWCRSVEPPCQASQPMYAAATGAMYERLDREALHRVDVRLLLGQAVRRERERQQQRDPRRPAVVDRQHHHGDGGQPDGDPLQPRSRSPSTTTPISTVTSGLMK